MAIHDLRALKHNIHMHKYLVVWPADSFGPEITIYRQYKYMFRAGIKPAPHNAAVHFSAIASIISSSMYTDDIRFDNVFTAV